MHYMSRRRQFSVRKNDNECIKKYKKLHTSCCQDKLEKRTVLMTSQLLVIGVSDNICTQTVCNFFDRKGL